MIKTRQYKLVYKFSLNNYSNIWKKLLQIDVKQRIEYIWWIYIYIYIYIYISYQEKEEVHIPKWFIVPAISNMMIKNWKKKASLELMQSGIVLLAMRLIIVILGNGSFLTENVTQDRKRSITHSKHDILIK